MDNEFRRRQDALLRQHEEWVREQGGLELPVHLDTYFQPHQIARLDWLKRESVGTILDVGCSWGYVLAYVEGEAGVDINPHLVALAQLLAPSRTFKEASAGSLPFPDDSFDTVIVAETLEHIPWPFGVQQAVQEAKRVARKRVLITTPAPDAPEADSFKDVWVATAGKQMALASNFPSSVSAERDGFFYLSAEL